MRVCVCVGGGQHECTVVLTRAAVIVQADAAMFIANALVCGQPAIRERVVACGCTNALVAMLARGPSEVAGMAAVSVYNLMCADLGECGCAARARVRQAVCTRVFDATLWICVCVCGV